MATDVGRRRSGNEDRGALWSAPPGAGTSIDQLLVVCDGMGGSNAGEVASALAAEIVVRELTSGPLEDVPTAIARAIETANQEVWSQSRAKPEWSGMGTTCTLLALRDGVALVGHVGDSRAYLVRNKQAHIVTRDHSLVAELVERGQLTADQAKTDPRRNVVTRSVGVAPDVEVDVTTAGDALRSGDSVVLCSDGLHGLVSDAEIAAIVSDQAPQEACTTLIALANERGGPDNITVAIAHVTRAGKAPGNPLGRWLRSWGGRGQG
jgi:protein phosphatase